MVPPNPQYQMQMPPVVACPRCRANIQLPPGTPIVACPQCQTCIQVVFAPPPPSFTHNPVMPTPTATWQQPGQHRPPAPQDAFRVSIDPPGGDSTIREVSIFNARPRSLLNFRRDRTVVVHRSSEGSTGEMVKVCELPPGKYHHVEGQRPERSGTRGMRRPGRCCSSGPSRSGPRSVQPPPRDPRPPCNERSWGAGGPCSGC